MQNLIMVRKSKIINQTVLGAIIKIQTAKNAMFVEDQIVKIKVLKILNMSNAKNLDR